MLGSRINTGSPESTLLFVLKNQKHFLTHMGSIIYTILIPIDTSYPVSTGCTDWCYQIVITECYQLPCFHRAALHSSINLQHLHSLHRRGELPSSHSSPAMRRMTASLTLKGTMASLAASADTFSTARSSTESGTSSRPHVIRKYSSRSSALSNPAVRSR